MLAGSTTIVSSTKAPIVSSASRREYIRAIRSDPITSMEPRMSPFRSPFKASHHGAKPAVGAVHRMSSTGITTLARHLGPASPLPSPKPQNSGLYALPRQIRADCRFYIALRRPGSRGTLRGSLACLRSRGLLVLAVHRLCHYYYALRPRTGRAPWKMMLRSLILVGRTFAIALAKSDIYYATVIDEGVHLSDDGHLTIAARRIGQGTIIHDRVTIGVKAGAGDIVPIVGENVWIGSNCVIYGDITIGDGATILPETVLSMNVPSRAVVAGNPARIIARDFDNTNLRRSLGAAVAETRFVHPCAPSVG